MNPIIEINTENLDFKNFDTLSIPYVCANDIPNIFGVNGSYDFSGYSDMIDYINSDILYDPPYSIFGTDCLGGFAYFGKKEDMLEIKQQADIYLQKSTEPLSYFLWEAQEHALLLLYENYQEKVDNPYPSQKNVMFLEFGAWISDYTLQYILTLTKEQKKMHGSMWYIGKEMFNNSNQSHKNLLSTFMNTLTTIYPNFSD